MIVVFRVLAKAFNLSLKNEYIMYFEKGQILSYGQVKRSADN